MQVCLQNLNGNYIAGPQLSAELANQLRPALPKLFKLCVKLSDEATSAAVRCELPVLFATYVELDERSAHLLFTKAEFRG